MAKRKDLSTNSIVMHTKGHAKDLTITHRLEARTLVFYKDVREVSQGDQAN